MTDAETIRELETLDEKELRDSFFELDGDGPDPGPPYAHQAMGLDRIERGASLTPPVSGILHYPTGAGKTRVGMELIARALRQNPKHRFIWATATKNLIRQSMVRMAELSQRFPKGTRFTWADAEDAKESDEDFHVVFMTRLALTRALDRAADGRANHAWKSHLIRDNPLTLIYDECHQLGADKLQKNLRKFYDSGLTRSWRVIGLSATPVPTKLESHRLLAERVFPRRSEMDSTSHAWPFHVFQRIQNEALIRQGVLCPINPYFDRTGEFDLPADLLRKVIGDVHLPELGTNADEVQVQRYAMKFNKGVMADPRVVAFLSQKLGKNLNLLGKTVAFVPNIDAANRMAGLLYDNFPALRGRVAAVHSKMHELRVPGQDEASVHQVLDRFRRLGDQPSILVNVEMLTEGFDDPKVRTVMLARLTLSTNRFWQMIGRGTRGPATKPPGTSECNVIDPLKLTRLYNYFAGYQPTFSSDKEIEFEELEEKGGGQDAVSPVVPQVVRPPDPALGVYVIDPELERVQTQVALALRHFLAGDSLSETQAVDVALKAQVKISEGRAVVVPSNGAFDQDTGSALLLGEITGLEKRVGLDLAWFRQKLPLQLTEPLLRQQLRMLRAIEGLGLRSESEFAEAQMRGDFLAAMQREAQGAGQRPAASSQSLAALATASAAEQAALDACLAMAGADGRVVDVEVATILETLRRMFGRAPTPDVEAAVRARPVPAAVPIERVEAALTPAQRQLLLWQMTEVAAADAIVTPEERAMLYGFAERLQIPVAYVESLVGAHLARADVQTGAPSQSEVPPTTCGSCGSSTPAAGAFCTSCGARIG